MNRFRHQLPKTRRNYSGFTLLEVMIAMIVFVLVAGVLQRVTAGVTDQYRWLELKTLASWIAENKMVELRAQDGLPPAKEMKEELDYSLFRWQILSKVSRTEDIYMNRVELVISQLDTPDGEPLQVLVYDGFVGLH
ncbi:MAG: type II secretion system minor pseudopilin GspI [Hahellaceae bacterium]|nr:type II secretion system minor pseudopilin GspI [Hahellaceae bacterium]MCP5170405.1 type II secretion system minor pseudopilin GspI [Hahellaceae bacterium]